MILWRILNGTFEIPHKYLTYTWSDIFYHTTLINSAWTFAGTVMTKFSAVYINGLVQDCSNSSALAMGLLQSCKKPQIYGIVTCKAKWRQYHKPIKDTVVNSFSVWEFINGQITWLLWRSLKHNMMGNGANQKLQTWPPEVIHQTEENTTRPDIERNQKSTKYCAVSSPATGGFVNKSLLINQKTN